MTSDNLQSFNHIRFHLFFVFFFSYAEGYFIYQEASNLIPFDTNRLESPDIIVSEKICIDFWYYMFGSEEMNELRVLIQDSMGESAVWSRKGSQNSLWNYGAITHTFLTERKIKVIIFRINLFVQYQHLFSLHRL